MEGFSLPNKDIRIRNIKGDSDKEIKKISTGGVISETDYLFYLDDYKEYSFFADIGTIDLNMTFESDGWDLDIYLYKAEDSFNSVASGELFDDADENISYHNSTYGQEYLIEVYCATEGESGLSEFWLNGTYVSLPPDLRITDITFPLNPWYTDWGEIHPISATVTVENIGPGPTLQNFWIDLYVREADDPPVGCMPGRFAIRCDEEIERYSSIDIDIEIFSNTPQRWNLFAVVDACNVITNEIDEGNNVFGPVEFEWRDEQKSIEYPWPYVDQFNPHSVTSVIGETRPNSGDDPLHTRYHNGMDIAGTNNVTVIYSSSSGYVQNKGLMGVQIGNHFYYHLGKPEDPYWSEFDDGDWVNEHVELGFIAELNHVHFAECRGGLYVNAGVNPLLSLGIVPDAATPAPTINEVFFVADQGVDPDEDANDEHNRLDPQNLSGKIDIVVKVKGRAFRMGVYAIIYGVENILEERMKFDYWVDELDSAPLAYTHYRPTAGYYRYRITNYYDPCNNGYLDCSDLTPGNHELTIWARDTYQNENEFNININIPGPPVNKDGLEGEMIPKNFKLEKNYPNPFNINTVIPYEVPRESLVKIEIYDLLGRKIRDIINEQKIPGYYLAIWNGINNEGVEMSSGLYIVRMTGETGEGKHFKSSYKINLVK